MHKKNKIINVHIWRGNAEAGSLVSYAVPVMKNQTVLDVVTWIQRHTEPGLAYRFACRVGMCGSCAMMVSGQPRWTCRTHVDSVITNNAITLEPLRNLPVIKDLVCDLSLFFDQWRKAKGYFIGSKDRQQPVEKISPQSTERKAAIAGIECINCGVCWAACDTVSLNPDYLGPAALNRAWTLINDSRDIAKTERLRAISAKGGCQTCHSQQGCTLYCPKELNPTRSIAGLKQVASLALLKGHI